MIVQSSHARTSREKTPLAESVFMIFGIMNFSREL